MNCPLTSWTWIIALLLAAVAGSDASLADAPRWVDEDMLLPWPEALRTDLSLDVRDEDDPTTISWGHSSTSEERLADEAASPSATADHQVKSASWFGSSLSDSIRPGWMKPASALDVVTTTRPSPTPCSQCEGWHVLPDGLLYRSYIAGEKEPRMAATFLSERDRGSVFEATIGGRLGFVRYGTAGPINPQGWQWDLEAAAMLRQDPERDLDVEATDFRIGSVITWRRGSTAVKAGYYHLSSHVGDEFLLRNTMFPRLNYVRDSLLIGVYHNLTDDLAIYGEIAYAFNTDGGAEPLELQFGTEYSPYDPTRSCGAPFVAVNGHLREEFDFGGSVNVLAGWQWIGPTSNRRLRIGGQYYNGKEIQWSFFDESVEFIGGGIWYDF